MLSLTWLSAICFSIAPIWAPTLKYGFISGAIMVFVIPDDSTVSGFILFTVALGFAQKKKFTGSRTGSDVIDVGNRLFETLIGCII